MQIISKAQLQQLIQQKKNFLLIDALPKESFQQQHIPGAINIPMKDNEEFVKHVQQHATMRDQNIVIYCRNKECPLSREAVEKLGREGFTHVQAFEEGVEGWYENCSSASGTSQALAGSDAAA